MASAEQAACGGDESLAQRHRAFLAREGCLVRTHGLSREDMNGLTGGVVGTQGAERLIVNLGGAHGRKALKVANLEAVTWYSHFVFMANVTGILLSGMYLTAMPFHHLLSMFLWRMCLLAYISYYAMICYNIGVFQFSLAGVQALAGCRPGQVLLWVTAFLILGQSCHALVGALGSYAVLSIAAVHDVAIAPPLARLPGIRYLVGKLRNVQAELRRVEVSMAFYDSKDWSATPIKDRPSPPVHYLEIAGVCFELFTGVTQFFMIVLSAAPSTVMLLISWRYLGYRYRTPENRSVRIVFNKAREKLDGYFEHWLVPAVARNVYGMVAERVWGEPMAA